METIAAVRLFSVRRWAAPVHRECVCADGSNADSGDDRSEVSIAAGGESSGGAAGVDHAEATARCGCHTGVAGKISCQEFIQRETICCRGLNFHLLRKKHKKISARTGPPTCWWQVVPVRSASASRGGWNRA